MRMLRRIYVCTVLAFLMVIPAWGQDKSWEKTWHEVLAGAKKEARLVLASSADPVLRKEILPQFTARFGIDVEFLAVQGNTGMARLRTEREAGVYSVDVWLAGLGSAITAHVEKMLEPFRPRLILPEVVDPSKWKKGKLWFTDPEQQYILRAFSTVVSPVSINTAYVSPEEIRSFKDLLNPKWKGKITSRDPVLGGSSDTLASVLYDRLGEEFVKKLYIDQKPVFSRDRRTTPEWLARGTYPICLACNSDELELLRKEGFKLLEIFEFTDAPAYLSAIPWVLVQMSRAPHPNAARVFQNWILSKEPMEIYSRGFGSVTLRTDVDESFLPANRIPRPGVNYVDTADWHWKTTREEEIAARVRTLLKR